MWKERYQIRRTFLHLLSNEVMGRPDETLPEGVMHRVARQWGLGEGRAFEDLIRKRLEGTRVKADVEEGEELLAWRDTGAGEVPSKIILFLLWRCPGEDSGDHIGVLDVIVVVHMV